MAEDLVCGMEVEEGKICSEYKGKTYCFCTEMCKKTFDENPDNYVKE